MAQVFTAVPTSMAARAAVDRDSAEAIAAAGAVELAVKFAAAAAAIGPIGERSYLVNCFLALANNDEGKMRVACGHADVGANTDHCASAAVTVDNA